jgi:hypothetical protein
MIHKDETLSWRTCFLIQAKNLIILDLKNEVRHLSWQMPPNLFF